MQTKVIAAIAVVIIIVIGVVVLQSNRSSNPVATAPEAVGTNTLKSDTKTEGEIMTNDKLMAGQTVPYADYSQEAVSKAQENGDKVVLFFHAAWCPYCKAADKAFKSNLDKIPNKTTVLKLDYDTNRDLKTKYGVTYQHTFVQIDTSGNKITAWNGGDIDSLITNLK